MAAIALARATASPQLKTICREMCADEAVHLRYEAQLPMTLRDYLSHGDAQRRTPAVGARLAGNAGALTARYVRAPQLDAEHANISARFDDVTNASAL